MSKDQHEKNTNRDAQVKDLNKWHIQSTHPVLEHISQQVVIVVKQFSRTDY